MSPNTEVVLAFLRAIEAGAEEEVLLRLLSPALEHRTLPNRVLPKGGAHGREGLLEAYRRRGAVEGERYQVHHVVESGPHVAVEFEWTGTLKVPLGSLAAGAQMRAHCAAFFTVRDGQIVSHRTYDCFEPF